MMEPLLKNLSLNSQEYLHLNEPFVSLENGTRIQAIREFIAKLDSGEYLTEPRPCLCGADDDVLVSEIDRYGIPLRTVLCRKCGLMRSDPYYTDATLEAFYRKEYRPIYTGEEKSTDTFFENQRQTGVNILDYLKPYLPGKATVYEIGAGAGGILQAFQDEGHVVKGCDYGSEYIQYGISKGIELHEGDFSTLISPLKADVLILNHLLEHIKNPVEFLKNVRQLLHPDGLVFIGLPGLVLYPVQYRSKLLFYLQNAHCYHYCLQTLQYVASLAGLSLVAGNEKIISVFRLENVGIEPPAATAPFLLEMIERAQRLAELQKSQDLKTRTLSEKVAEHKDSLRRVRGALKKAKRLIEQQQESLEENQAEIELQTTQMAKLRSDLEKKKKEIAAIKGSFGWKFISFIRKLDGKLGISAAYRFCIKKPVLFLARKKHWHLLFRILPINRSVILFESHRGLSYSDSPKAICEAILARGLPVRCVWSLHDPALILPEQVRKVRRFSIPYYYYHACARILIQNGEFAQNLPIRRKQTYINTQHGTPLKLMGTDILHKKPNLDLTTYSKDGRWSYLVSPNSYTTEIFKRAYIYTGPVLEAGYPRNDIFHRRNTPADIVAIKRKLGLPLDKKIMLYAPTWRDLGSNRIDRNFKLKLEIDRLFEQFGGSHVIILRLHHLIVSVLKIDGALSGFAFECSSAQYDIQELMLVSDILITDYSSVMFDYANLWRPIIFFAYDLAEYSSDIRGTYFDLKQDAPGPVVENMDDLIGAIRDIDHRILDFADKRKAFHEKFCSLEDGTASDRVIDRIIKPEMGLT